MMVEDEEEKNKFSITARNEDEKNMSHEKNDLKLIL